MYYKRGSEQARWLGTEGENRVAEYLRKQGYIIIKRNYHDRFGEIDIVAEKGDVIAFVEVKTRFEGSMVSGLEAINAQKQRRLRITGSDFLQKISGDYTGRFDAAQVEVFMKDDGSLGWKLTYIKDAF